MLSDSKTQVMSDGTDAATLPYQYSLVQHWLKTSPSFLLYGSIFNPFSDAPVGSTLWMSWIEKVVAVVAMPFVSLEQMSTFVALALMVLNGWCCYLLCRSFNWPKPLCVALAICWAFNPYVRARSKVHIALAAIYFLPLTFLALNLVKKCSDKKSLAWAAFAFFVAALAPQYYLIITAFVAPFLIWYVLLGAEKSAWIQKLTRLGIASVPAVALVLWTFFKPVPSSVISPNLTLRPTTGQTSPDQELHPFLNTFGARLSDFVSGDVGIGPSDFNFIRGAINHSIYENKFDGSNPHERSNGIRWTLFALVFIGLYFWFNKESRSQHFSDIANSYIVFFSIFTLTAIWMSLSPNTFGLESLMPATWFFHLISQYRVPSRAGIFVHFGMLMLAGIFASHLIYKLKKSSQKKKDKSQAIAESSFFESLFASDPSSKWKRRLALPMALPIIVLLDFPPFMNAMPVAPISARYQKLIDSTDQDTCGAGLYFPYVSHTYALKEMYYFMQQLRGSKCDYLNKAKNDEGNQNLLRRFALHPQVMQAIQQNNPNFQNGFIQFARCVPLEWVVFDAQVPQTWQADTCQKLGWQLDSQGVCRSSVKNIKILKTPEQC